MSCEQQCSRKKTDLVVFFLDSLSHQDSLCYIDSESSRWYRDRDSISCVRVPEIKTRLGFFSGLCSCGSYDPLYSVVTGISLCSSCLFHP